MIRRREIDGLRALAVVPVILFHAGLETVSGGFIGVDIFFVISGYLITSIIIAEKDAGTFTLANFYERRVRRILPALFFVMLVCLPFSSYFLYPNELSNFSDSLMSVTTFVSNILFWRTIDYFGPTAEHMPLLHTWSLAVEEQYYLLFPLFLIATWRLGRRWIVPILIVLALISLAFAQWGSKNTPIAAFFLLPMRGWELLIGALIAFYFDKRGSIAHGPLSQLGSLAGLALILYAIFAFDRYTPFPGFHALVPTVGAALIILFATPSTVVGAALASDIPVGIGLISYSAYLWHQPLFALIRHESVTEPTLPEVALLSILVCILAYLTWRFIEQPFRRKGVVRGANLVAFTAVGTVMFFAFGVAGHVTNGFDELKLNAAQRAILQAELFSPKRAECHTSGNDYMKPAKACEYFEKNVTWAVVGNSHGVELAYSLAKQLRSRQEGLKHFTFSACEPLGGNLLELPDGCANWTEETLSYIEHDPRIQNVVLSYKLHDLIYGVEDEEDAENEAGQWQAYVAMAERLVRAKKTVILVLQAPQLTRNVQHFVMWETANFDFVAGVSRSLWDYSSSYEKSHLGDLPHSVSVIDPTQLFCNEQDCAAIKNGAALYFDAHHMSPAGGDLIAAEILRRIPDINDINDIHS